MPKAVKSVLFICKGNWFRSQMAAALYDQLTGVAASDSAGTYAGAPDEPEGQRIGDLFPTPEFFELMEARGMQIRDRRTRRFRPEMLDRFDLIVCMAEDPYVPDVLRRHPGVIWWDVPNPRHLDAQIAQEIFDLVQAHVRTLIPDAAS